jgi:hypothetical protein
MEEKKFFCILKVTEESILIRSWIRIRKSEVRVWIPTKIHITDPQHWLQLARCI